MPKSDQHFFRYAPEDQQPGFNPLVGDVEPGRVYEVAPHLAERFEDHPEWESASKRAFEAQDDEQETPSA